ncbi:transposase [Bradyrhizobium sp. 197]|nr:transposase [Bradyrhizobium sp. 197]
MRDPRSDHPAACPLAPDCGRACRAQTAAHVLFAKYGLHLPLNRQSDVYQREGIVLDGSTLSGLGRYLRSNPEAFGRWDPEPRLRSRTHPRRSTQKG